MTASRSIPSLKRVLIMAGGTGGHIFPALATALFFQKEGVEIHWLGTKEGLEAQLVPEANLPLHTIKIAGVRGKGLQTLYKAPYSIAKATRQAQLVLQKIKPDLVIGFGGFASGPGGLASILLRYPLIIHEQNAKAGLTNRLLAPFSKRVLQGFPNTFAPKFSAITVGNPVRATLENLLPPAKRFAETDRPFNLLVLGGSRGAQALNELIPHALSLLRPDERPQLVHQTGERHFGATKILYAKLGLKISSELQVVPFIKDMAKAYSDADMVLCRAGALTVAEICAVGVGAIFVPYPFAVDDHQTANAEFLVKKNAALCIQQKELTSETLVVMLREFAKDEGRRASMAQAAYELRKTNVAAAIYQICEEIWH